MSQLWTDKFAPQNFDSFVGNVEIVGEVRKWASVWNEGKKGKPLLFFGPTGTGKTQLAMLIAKEFDWELFELNASDFRSKDVIDRVVGIASQGASLHGKKRLILLDEVDGLQARDRGGAAAIAKIIKESSNPVILTANDIYKDQKLAAIRAYTSLMQFKRINYLSIANRLKQFLEQEGHLFDPEAIKELARNCKGDFRSALLDTQTLALEKNISMDSVASLGFRERQENVFKVVEAIFKGKTVDEVRNARFSSEISNDMLFRWVEENIPRAYTDAGDVAAAFNVLSRADIFEGRIFNRQHYGFKRYSSELFTSGVALSKEHECSGWLKLQFPQLLKNLSASSSKRAMKKELGKKVGGKTHTSPRQVMAEDLPFLKMIFKDKEMAEKLSAEFSLEPAEIAFLLDTKLTTKKVQTIFENAAEIKKNYLISKRKHFKTSPENTLHEFEEPKENVQLEPEEDLGHSQTTLF